MSTATSGRPGASGNGVAVAPLGIAAATALVLVLLVASSLTRRGPPAFEPTPPGERPADGRLVGPALVTVDARASDRWRYFSFDRGTVLDRPGPTDWDLAFQRFRVIVNGGPGFAGEGGALDLGEVPFEAVRILPEDGYLPNRVASDTTNAGFGKWYTYSFLSHLLAPKPRVYAIRTADGRYAKLEMVGYYCEGAAPGCLTFRYVYQGAGSRSLVEGDGSP